MQNPYDSRTAMASSQANSRRHFGGGEGGVERGDGEGGVEGGDVGKGGEAARARRGRR